MTNHHKRADFKRCPFCGSDGDVEAHNYYKFEEFWNGNELISLKRVKGYLVMCGYCCNQTMLWDTKAEAIKAWNKRIEITPKGKL